MKKIIKSGALLITLLISNIAWAGSLSDKFFNYWQEIIQQDEEYVSENGFVSLPKPTNLDTDSVIILAAINCSKEAARRADDLANDLANRNISYTRANRISFENYAPALKKRLDSVMRGPLPIVLIDGRGKANPTLNEVLSEYDAIYE